MQSVKWVTFGISNALTRTVVHFFPSEGGVTAPYPATCGLRIFGQGVQEKRVVIEGARLSHPDGVRVEDAFPSLKSDQVGLFGLEIEVATIQPRVDLSASSCVVELASKGHSAKFWPKRVQSALPLHLKPNLKRVEEKKSEEKMNEVPSEEQGVKTVKPRVTPLLKDSFHTTSVVMVNGSTSPFQPPLSLYSGGRGVVQGEGTVSSSDTVSSWEAEFPLSALAPGIASEMLVDDESGRIFAEVNPQACSWGLFRGRSLVSREAESPECQGVFVMYRDSLTKRPVSVSVV